MINYTELIANKIAKITNLDQKELEEYIEIPPKADMGDYAFPCFKLAKALKKSPIIIATEIKDQLSTDEYIDRFNAPGMLNYVMSVMACKYYKSSSYSHYLHIPYEGYKLLYESISSVNNKRPNFIKKVVEVGSCNILSEQCDLYRFECRPYGYITPSGKLIYDFDVNSIKL